MRTGLKRSLSFRRHIRGFSRAVIEATGRSAATIAPAAKRPPRHDHKNARGGGIEMRTRKIITAIAAIFIGVCLCIPSVSLPAYATGKEYVASARSMTGLDLLKIPAYSGDPTYPVNGNIPDFSKKEITKKSFERYSDLDDLGRCQAAEACLSKDTMPTKKRGEIGMVKPAGWHTVKYPDLIKDKYLYNRCHLIAFELGAENANEKNLTTGTRYMNVTGMLPYENEVAEYIRETGNHVMYRVTPEFVGNELVCRGVLMEAYSVEDKGEGIEFAEFVYNVQPGIVIDYKTGDSHPASGKDIKDNTAVQKSIARHEKKESKQHTYVINTRSGVFHKPSCESVEAMSARNKKAVKSSRADMVRQGYKPCKICNP